MERMMWGSVTSKSCVAPDHRPIIGAQNTRLTAKRRSAVQTKQAVCRAKLSSRKTPSLFEGSDEGLFLSGRKREKWQLQHLGNYFHTERGLMRSAAPLLPLFALAPRWCWAAGITPDPWLAPLSTRNFLLSLAEEGLRAQRYLAQRRAARAHTRMHTHKQASVTVGQKYFCNYLHVQTKVLCVFFFSVQLFLSCKYAVTFTHTRTWINTNTCMRCRTDAHA